MSDTLPPLRFRWATYCDRGLVRDHNQDALWAGAAAAGLVLGRWSPRGGGSAWFSPGRL
jgi:serine/threonine protein phosphatase PrpC